MKKVIMFLSFIVAGVFFTASYADAGIVVNGDLSDWGVTPGAYGFSQWVPKSGIVYNEEDQNIDHVGPGYGGQKFDAEAIYATRENGFMCLAIVTGHPVAGWNGYMPGDIFFNFGTGAQYGLKTTGADAGKLYKNPLWNTSPYWGGITDPTTMVAGSGEYKGYLDSSLYVYLNTYVGAGDSNNHWVMEMAIPDSYFDDNWSKSGTAHWTQTCGNDAIDLEFPAETPEPATMALLGLGLAGLLRLRKKRVS